MSSSKQRLEANRANAKRSTGPKTREGKKRSSGNAYKLGLTARLLLDGEDVAEFDRLRRQLVQDYKPQSTLAVELVEDLARTLLQKRRAAFFEAAMLEARFQQVVERSARSPLDELLSDPFCFPASSAGEEQEKEVPKLSVEAEWRVRLGEALLHDAAYGDLLSKLDRHRAMLTNEIMKTVKLLLLVEGTYAGVQDEQCLIEQTPMESKK